MSEFSSNQDHSDHLDAELDAQISIPIQKQPQLTECLISSSDWLAAGKLVVNGATLFQLDQGDYDLTTTALNTLGITKGIPDYNVLAANLAASTSTAEYLGIHLDAGDVPELTFDLPLGHASGITSPMNDLTLPSLLDRFDKQQPHKTSVTEDIWDRQDHTVGQADSLNPVIALNDTHDLKDSTRPVNGYDETGLVNVTQTVDEQRYNLATEAKLAANKSIEIQPMSIGQYVVLQAKRREAGLPLLDERTATRLVQYPNRTYGDRQAVPVVSVGGDGQLRLDRSHVDIDWYRMGVRRVVKI
jgi:hypothetical protein